MTRPSGGNSDPLSKTRIRRTQLQPEIFSDRHLFGKTALFPKTVETRRCRKLAEPLGRNAISDVRLGGGREPGVLSDRPSLFAQRSAMCPLWTGQSEIRAGLRMSRGARARLIGAGLVSGVATDVCR